MPYTPSLTRPPASPPHNLPYALFRSHPLAHPPSHPLPLTPAPAHACSRSQPHIPLSPPIASHPPSPPSHLQQLLLVRLPRRQQLPARRQQRLHGAALVRDHVRLLSQRPRPGRSRPCGAGSAAPAGFPCGPCPRRGGGRWVCSELLCACVYIGDQGIRGASGK